MATIKPNCRERFSTEDLAFIATSLAGNADVTGLLRDADALDAALESDRLLKTILESPANIPVSSQLYFYVLTRHMLMRFDRSVADYVAGRLAEFVDAPGARAVPYLTDMLIALRTASAEQEFVIRVQVADQSLFLAGIFPEHIAQRAQRKAAPPLAFYEEVGSENYRLASDHRLARRDGLADILQTIADHFTDVRVGLNRMSDRLLCLESAGGLPA